MRKAIVFGATGLVGSSLIDLLISDERYSEVLCFVRTKQDYSSEKIKQELFQINEIEKIGSLIQGDDLFICLGTTQAKSKSKEDYRQVDLFGPAKIAEFANNNGIQNICAISSIGVKSTSNTGFYLKTKAEMEKAILSLNFSNTNIVRPSLLLGKRSEFRLGEDFGKVIYKVLGFLFIGKLKKYKGIHAEDVAKAMIVLSNNKQNKSIFESDELAEKAKLWMAKN